VTAVTVAGTVVTITVLSDGPSICDPNQTGVPAGEPVNWTADYDVRAEYKRRVQATIRVYYESYIVQGRRSGSYARGRSGTAAPARRRALASPASNGSASVAGRPWAPRRCDRHAGALAVRRADGPIWGLAPRVSIMA
jgi:hypothetical protein